MTDPEALERLIEQIIEGIGSPWGEGASYSKEGGESHLDESSQESLRRDLKALLDQARKEAVEKALWRVQSICAEYPTNEKTNIPYRVILEACDTALDEADAKEEPKM